MTARSRIVLGFAAAALSAASLVPSSAEAATTPGSFTFCNATFAREFVSFPFDGAKSDVLYGGECWSTHRPGHRYEQVVAHRYLDGHWSVVATTAIDDDARVRWVV